ncbi:hypothetical protein Pint_03489 [Pistacia integerrima]|uniref:Uncharacterized protein n=1 Tax=Pistacia integerrima TaxID=434235 RepID=A0ACC0ZNS5_9ROSI|nr:hypothetical protein Pint_03489 [Pistacia integerrima]
MSCISEIPEEQDKKAMKTDVLALTEDEILPVSEVLNVIREISNEAVEQCDPQIITQVSSLTNITSPLLGQLPVESTCIGIVISSCRSLEFPPDKLFEEISRVLQPGGIIVVYKNIKCDKEDAAKVKGKKPCRKIGSSFPIKKAPKSLFKVQINDDYDLIDEEALLTEEDLKKPQLPSSKIAKIKISDL